MANLTVLRHRRLGIAIHHQPPDHYRLLGLPRLELNSDVIDHAAERQLDHLHREPNALQNPQLVELCGQIDGARRCLLSHDEHLDYAARLQGYPSDSDDLELQAAWRTFAEEFEEAWLTAQRDRPDTQHLWLGIARHQRPASNDCLLGLDVGERDAEVIRSAADRQISFVRKFAAGEKADDAQRLLGQLSRARSTLLKMAEVTAAEVAQHVSSPVARGNEQADSQDGIEDGVTDESKSALLDLTPSTPELRIGKLELEPPVESPLLGPPSSYLSPPPPAVLPEVRDDRKRLVVTAMVGSAAFLVLMLLGLFALPMIWPPDDVTRPDAGLSRVPSGNALPGHASTSRKHSTETGPGMRSSQRVPPSSQRDADLEFSRFIARSISSAPTELDLEEIEYYASLARTPPQQRSIGTIRQRFISWQSHRGRIDDAKFIGKLIQLESILQQVERRIARSEGGENDSVLLADATAKLDKMPAEFPNHTEMAIERYRQVDAWAEQLLGQLDHSELDETPSETPNNGIPGENPFVVVTPPISNLGEPLDESVDSVTEAAEVEAAEVEAAAESSLMRTERTWTTISGVTFKAVVVDVDPEVVMFRRSIDDRKASMKMDKLSDADQSKLLSFLYDRADAEQFQSAVKLIPAVQSDPAPAIVPLRKSHVRYVDSPYAGLWAAVCMGEGLNQTDEAARLLLQVIRRIREQQARDDQRHRVTLAAARNNLAICKIKAGEWDSAAIQLTQALEDAPQAFPVAIHNGRQLLSSTSEGRLLDADARVKLEQALFKTEKVTSVLSSGWYYSLDADRPRFRHENIGVVELPFPQSRSAVAGEPVVQDRWCLSCKGSGVIPCGYGNCRRGSIVVKQRVQLAINQVTGEAIYGDKNFKQICHQCRGESNFDCLQCSGGRVTDADRERLEVDSELLDAN
ncbi:MAG: hypothetical protein P8L85_14480 [Rubripirellula sp.]|nr:hypothetical protein [Rubripirellula sp.]